MNWLTKLKEKLSDGILIDESNHFIINIIITYIASIFIFALGQVLLIPTIILWIIEPIFKKVSFKRKLNIDKIMISWEKKLLKKNSKYILLENNSSRLPLLISDNRELYQFINDFILRYNNRYLTYTISESFVCDIYKRRSLGDIFLICRAYYPNCTIIDVLKVLIKLIHESYISGSRCSTIEKFVFYSGGRDSALNSNVEYCNELTFNKIIEYYKPKE